MKPRANTNKLLRASGGSNQFGYDLNGNVDSSATENLTSLAYDPFTQMTMSVTSTTNGTISFEYDGKKERILKKVENGSTTKTLYLRGLSDYPLVEKTSSGAERKYVYGPTGLLAVIENGSVYYLFKDHLKSTRAVMNGATGAGVEYNAYNAWGELMASQTSPDVRYKYTGQEYDAQTGIYNYRARMYDEELGRFYAIDPAGVGFSPYNYAANNPVSFTDPSGRKPEWWEDYEKEMENQRRNFMQDELERRQNAANLAGALNGGDVFAGDEFFIDGSWVRAWSKNEVFMKLISSNMYLREEWLEGPMAGKIEWDKISFHWGKSHPSTNKFTITNDGLFYDPETGETKYGLTSAANDDKGNLTGDIDISIAYVFGDPQSEFFYEKNPIYLTLVLDHELYHAYQFQSAYSAGNLQISDEEISEIEAYSHQTNILKAMFDYNHQDTFNHYYEWWDKIAFNATGVHLLR